MGAKASRPSPLPDLYWTAMTYDPASGQAVVFRGKQDPGGEMSNHTWTWDGGDWSERT